MAAKRANKRFCYELPKGWQDQTVYNFIGPEDSGIQHSVRMIIDRHLLVKEISRFARQRTQPIEDSLQSVEVLKNEETTVEGCHPSWEFIYKWVLAEDRVMIQTYIFVICEKMGFTFEARFTKRTFNTVGRQLHEVVEALLPGTFEPLEDD
ncbi:DUF1795 domain-containing protein [candidate division GN15 bacterium]|nr:DUF1795 domain-containing protein [candidate division GN15 bacterium]